MLSLFLDSMVIFLASTTFCSSFCAIFCSIVLIFLSHWGKVSWGFWV